jgi:small-conductance mechanosensitive channel
VTPPAPPYNRAVIDLLIGPALLRSSLAIEIDGEKVLEDVLRHGGRILLVVAIAAAVLFLLQRLISPVMGVAVREQMAGEPQVEIDKRVQTLSHVVYRTLFAVVVVVAVLASLPEFGVSIAPFLAGVGLVGLAVGFGAQNLVRDVINGLFILVENQYAKGDVVNIAGMGGLVEDINLRRTVLRDLDGTVHFVPHGEIKTASNLTKGFSRVNLNVGVAYDSDIDHVFRVIDRVGEELAADPEWAPMVKAPPRALRVDAFADSAIEVKVVGETEPIQQWAVTGELRRRLKRAFDAEGIVIPFPQRVVHNGRES